MTKTIDDKKASIRVEFYCGVNGDVGIKYYGDVESELSLNWKMPEYIVMELNRWWEKMKENEEIVFPVNERLKRCEFTMQTGKYIDIKEIDELGRYKTIGWSLPSIIVDKLIIWHKSKKG